MISPFLTQTRTFQRRLFQYALEMTGGDVGWAAGSLGVSEIYFRLRAEQLGGVFDLSEVNNDFDNDIWDDVYEDPEAVEPELETAGESLDPFNIAQESVQPEPVVELPREEYKKPTIAQQPELLSKIDAILNMPAAVAPEVVPQETASVPLQDAEISEDKPVEVRGRKPAVSPNPKFMTRKQVEDLLGLSTTGVMRLRAKGDLNAILDPSIAALLFDKDQVEEYARKRAEAREAKRADS